MLRKAKLIKRTTLIFIRRLVMLWIWPGLNFNAVLNFFEPTRLVLPPIGNPVPVAYFLFVTLVVLIRRVFPWRNVSCSGFEFDSWFIFWVVVRIILKRYNLLYRSLVRNIISNFFDACLFAPYTNKSKGLPILQIPYLFRPKLWKPFFAGPQHGCSTFILAGSHNYVPSWHFKHINEIVKIEHGFEGVKY